MEELKIPTGWEHRPDGTYRVRVYLWGKNDTLSPEMVRLDPPQRVTELHVGWAGKELVSQRPDGSHREPFDPSEILEHRWRIELQWAGRFGGSAASEPAKKVSAAPTDPSCELDGLDIIARDRDGAEIVRVRPDQWDGPHGERLARLSRRFTTAGLTVSHARRAELAAAYDAALATSAASS